MKMEKRSPLKASPLRNPGQSLDEKIDKILDEEAYACVLDAEFFSQQGTFFVEPVVLC